jgi:type VI secretion system protein ImpA
MQSFSDLLRPISPQSPAGADLRYDPVMDQIREARMEEDDSLPVGDWGRQLKRADYSRVASLASDELLKRSKDLWLAGWLGEAWIRLEGLQGLERTLRFLLELQQEFWSSLHPEIEDGDTTLRAAPLQWSLNAYALLVYEFPVEARETGYSIYKALRSDVRLAEGEGALTVETLDGFIAASPKVFYQDGERLLAHCREVLDQLYMFCEEHYGEDGPSFVRLRSAIDELHHVFSQILRQKPDVRAPELESQSFSSEEASGAVVDEHVVPYKVELERIQDEPLSISDSPAAHQSVSQPVTWQDVQQHLESCAAFCRQNAQEDSLSLLFALTQQRVLRQIDGEQLNSPSSDTRLTLKQAADYGDWENLLQASLAAIRRHNGPPWLDLFRYLCVAAKGLSSSELDQLSISLVQGVLRNNSGLPAKTFSDGTPIADSETQAWIKSEVIPTAKEADAAPQRGISPPSSSETDQDIYTEAVLLAKEGSLEQAIHLLMGDTSAFTSGRGRFLRLLDLSRLFIRTGNVVLANGVLKKMVEELDERRLETWEDRDLVGEVLFMLLQTMSRDDLHLERNALFSRLCHIHPSLALAIRSMNQE